MVNVVSIYCQPPLLSQKHFPDTCLRLGQPERPGQLSFYTDAKFNTQLIMVIWTAVEHASCQTTKGPPLHPPLKKKKPYVVFLGIM